MARVQQTRNQVLPFTKNEGDRDGKDAVGSHPRLVVENQADMDKQFNPQWLSEDKHPLYHHGMCRWAGCETAFDSFAKFQEHLGHVHTLNERSTAQVRVQIQIISQIESHLVKEKDRLEAMMAHLAPNQSPSESGIKVSGDKSKANETYFRTRDDFDSLQNLDDQRNRAEFHQRAFSRNNIPVSSSSPRQVSGFKCLFCGL